MPRERDLLENVLLNPNTAKSIDQHVQKVLHDLDNPEPPLDLSDVRELLKLDRAYYSSADHDVLDEVIHRLKVAGRQNIKRPTILKDVIKKKGLNALWLPDRKRILIDSDVPRMKQRWGEAHEIGHSIIPWHEWLSHGDQKRTLSHTCEHKVEAEANYAAGRLLFLQDRFIEEVRSGHTCFAGIRELARSYDNSITSTLCRAMEALETPAFGLGSVHPQEEPQQGTEPVKYYLRSASFADEFPSITAMEIFQILGDFCFRKRGPIGTQEVLIKDTNGNDHIFLIECFYNHYDALTLGVFQRVHSVSVSVGNN